MNTTQSTKAATAYLMPTGEIAEIDTLSTPAAIKIQARNLRPNMVIIDPMLGTPYAVLDAKRRSTRNSGNVEFLAIDLETNRAFDFAMFANSTATVMAA